MSKLVRESINDYLPAPSEKEILSRIEYKGQFENDIDEILKLYTKAKRDNLNKTIKEKLRSVAYEKLENLINTNPIMAYRYIYVYDFKELYPKVITEVKKTLKRLVTSSPKYVMTVIFKTINKEHLNREFQNIFHEASKHLDDSLFHVDPSNYQTLFFFDFEDMNFSVDLEELSYNDEDNRDYTYTLNLYKKIIKTQEKWKQKETEEAKLMRDIEEILRKLGYEIDYSRKIRFDKSNVPQEFIVPFKRN